MYNKFYSMENTGYFIINLNRDLIFETFYEETFSFKLSYYIIIFHDNIKDFYSRFLKSKETTPL